MMAEATWALLKRLFVTDYATMSRKMERLTGSADLAGEALQDTYLRLEQGGDIADHLVSPHNYLLKMALNSARKILRKDRARSRYIQLVDQFDFEVSDDTPRQDREVQAHSDLNAVKAVLTGMPERRRAIFLLALFEDVPLADIAQRYGIGLRMVQLELKAAREQIVATMEGSNVIRFAHPDRNASEG